MTERTFRLADVSIIADGLRVLAASATEFDMQARDRARLGVAYEFQDTSVPERARVRITANLDGRPAQTREAFLRDIPMLNDSRVGFLELPLGNLEAGMHRGSFRVEAEHEIDEGSGFRTDHAKAEGVFTVRVK